MIVGTIDERLKDCQVNEVTLVFVREHKSD